MDCPKLDGKAKDFLKQQKEGHTIVYFGAGERGQKGVAIWLLRKIGESLIGYNPLSNSVDSQNKYKAQTQFDNIHVQPCNNSRGRKFRSVF